MKILLVEDDPGIGRLISRTLEQGGYDVEVASDGLRGLAAARGSSYGLLILDVMLPGMDGWRICEELRESGNRVPILMATARDMVDDRVRGLEIGADDYISKPFQVEELVARVRALLRRDKIHRARVIRVADLVIDTAQRKVTRAGVPVGLSHKEYELLEALAAHESQVLTREVIQERVWMDQESYSNTVDVYINMLRKKIDAGHNVKLIQTIRGWGYTLRGGASA